MQLTGPMAGQRAPDTSNHGDPFAILTSLKEHLSPAAVPLLYQLYMQYVGNPGEFELPINLCEQQHKKPGQYTSTLMVMEQEFIEREVPRNDKLIPNLKNVARDTLVKQRKLCMKNNGQHGGNGDRKILSEEVGMTYLRLCGCDEAIRALLAYKNLDPKNNEIDDIFDALNLLLATGVEVYAREAKLRDPTCMPLETGACLDRGKTFIRWHGTDPGEVKHATVIADTGRLYPPLKNQMTLYHNDTGTGKEDDPTKDVLMALPAFRILSMQLTNLRTNKILFKWECADVDAEPFYAPTQRDIMVMIKEATAEREERKRLNKVEGAKKAAETRKRKKLEAAGMVGVIEIKDEDSASEDVVERARKRAKIEIE